MLVDFETLVATHLDSGAARTLQIRKITPAPHGNDDTQSRRQPIDALEESDWKKAWERLEAIRPLLERDRAGRSDVEARAAEVGCSATTLYTWLGRYRDTHDLTALVPRRRGWRSGNSRISAQAEAVIAQAIKDVYLNKDRRKAIKVVQQVRSLCAKRGITPPSEPTIRARIAKIPEEERMRKRGFAEEANRRFSDNPCLKEGCSKAVADNAKSFTRGDVALHFNRAEHLYADWPHPVCIISDGPYGLSGFPGDLPDVNDLADWYHPHVRAWTKKATPETTLWFWNSELGWATVHPILAQHGWEYRNCHVWDKGIGHIAGNSNTATLRKFPVITEVCVQYVKQARLDGMTLRDWLRHEWKRTELPLRLANEACGVKNAATRKYLTADHLWYFPPPDAFQAMAAYANTHGRPAGRPYFSADGKRPIQREEWARQRAKFRCKAGLTNVWRAPHVSGAERVNGTRTAMRWKFKSLHGSQKPLTLVDIAIAASTDPGDVVWEPFGGLCPAAVCALRSRRACYSAEIIPEFYHAAVRRLSDA